MLIKQRLPGGGETYPNFGGKEEEGGSSRPEERKDWAGAARGIGLREKRRRA